MKCLKVRHLAHSSDDLLKIWLIKNCMRKTDYFTQMRYPVPEEVHDEVIRHICKILKLSIVPEVFV